MLKLDPFEAKPTQATSTWFLRRIPSSGETRKVGGWGRVGWRGSARHYLPCLGGKVVDSPRVPASFRVSFTSLGCGVEEDRARPRQAQLFYLVMLQLFRLGLLCLY